MPQSFPLDREPVPVVFMLNSLLPYNQHLCKRLVAEIPEVQWQFVFTNSGGEWETDWPENAAVVYLWKPEPPLDPGRYVPAEEYFRRIRVSSFSAAIVSGYHREGNRRLIKYCREQRTPFFVRADSNILGDRRLNWFQKLAKKLVVKQRITGLAGALPMGRMGVQYFEQFGVPSSKMHLVPHEPDYRQFQNVDPERLQRFCGENQLSSDRRRILCCNRLVQAKNVELLIQAFNRLAPRHPQWDLVVLGQGPMKSELMQLVETELKPRVIWMGQRQLPEVILTFNACDLFVLASRFEPWATVISEAAGAGLPIVASDVVGAAHEVFRDGSGGRLFETENLGELESALEDVINNLDEFRAGIIQDLGRWREEADPVSGIRRALANECVLAQPSECS